MERGGGEQRERKGRRGVGGERPLLHYVMGWWLMLHGWTWLREWALVLLPPIGR